MSVLSLWFFCMKLIIWLIRSGCMSEVVVLIRFRVMMMIRMLWCFVRYGSSWWKLVCGLLLVEWWLNRLWWGLVVVFMV